MIVESVSVAGQRSDDGSSVFPLVLQCKSPDVDMDEVRSWVAEHGASLIQQAADHGAILFRGFPLRTDQDFDAFIRAFGLPNFAYADSLSNAVRTNRTERVFTANEAPANVNICLHHEMAQTPVFPSRLFFFCEHAADKGGQTPLCRSDVLWARMQKALPEFTQACEEKGLLYSHVMPAADDPGSGMGRSWQSTWKAETREQAEARMRELGYTWEWLDDGCLRVTTPRLPAVRPLGQGRAAFFNQLIAAFQGWKDVRNDPSKAVTFGDGTPLDPQVMQRVIELADELTFDLPWQVGDVALVDNYVAMHGRRPFEGTRRVLASLVAS